MASIPSLADCCREIASFRISLFILNNNIIRNPILRSLSHGFHLSSSITVRHGFGGLLRRFFSRQRRCAQLFDDSGVEDDFYLFSINVGAV